MDQLSTVPAPEPAFERPKRKRHLAFCRQVALGMEPHKAYFRYISGSIPGNGTASLKTAFERGWQFTRRWASYISHLRNKLGEQMDNAAIAGKLELLQRDSRALRTPAELAADPASDLATVTVTIGPDGERTTKIQGPDKDAAAARLAKIQGLDAPQQIQVNHLVLDSPALAILDGRNNNKNDRLSLVSNLKTEPIEAELVEVDGGQNVNKSIQSAEESAPLQPWIDPDQILAGAGPEQDQAQV